MCRGVFCSYFARRGSRSTRAHRAYHLVGSISFPRIGGHPGAPVGPTPLISWEGAAQLGGLQHVGPAVWSELGRFLLSILLDASFVLVPLI